VTAARAVDAARAIIERALLSRIFPAASLDAGSSAESLWSDALGRLTFADTASPATIDTPFDLASLTKVVATTTALMELVRTGRLRLDEPVSRFFDEWRGADRDRATVRDLLEHAAGLAPRLIDAPPASRREFEHDICLMPLEYAARARAVYSDLDFILLGFLAADRGNASLDELFDRLVGADPPGKSAETVGSRMTFALSPDEKRLAAPTLPLAEDPRRGRSLSGEVHDNYAAALGGVAGHAGLFGSARALGAFARIVLRAARGDASTPPPLTPALMREFTTRSTVPDSSRALGWDTMLPTSSCGTRMSAAAFGHVGFTGTSLWIDPERDRYFVLLTNRANGGGSLDEMRTVRRSFHDALGDF
jgi:CubicO group peptidase (beta-lactamase class C family)